MQIFSSDTNEWRNSIVSSPRKLNFPLNLNPFMPIACYAGVIACNGMLHWVWVEDKEIKGIVVFDPFNDLEQCHYIHPPIDLSLRHHVSLGVFRGRLRIFQLISYYPHNFYAGSFSLWELEDYSNAGTWCMKQKVYFSNMVFGDYPEKANLLKIYGLDYVKDPERAKIMLYRYMTFLAFHPNDGNSVFLDCGDSVQLCNLRTGELKRVRYYSYHIRVRSKFQLVQPSWPTPVPPVPLNAPSILMGLAKTQGSSRVAPEDDSLIEIVISIMVVGPRKAVPPPSILGLLRNIYSPLLPLKEQLTISPTPIRYKEGMNVTFNAPTDKRQVYINGRLRRKGGKKHTNTLTHT